MALHPREVAAGQGGRAAVRSGHRSAHLWVVIVSAILAASVLIFGWIARSQRPVPEPLAAAGWSADAHSRPAAAPGGAT